MLTDPKSLDAILRDMEERQRAASRWVDTAPASDVPYAAEAAIDDIPRLVAALREAVELLRESNRLSAINNHGRDTNDWRSDAQIDVAIAAAAAKYNADDERAITAKLTGRGSETASQGVALAARSGCLRLRP